MLLSSTIIHQQDRLAPWEVQSSTATCRLRAVRLHRLMSRLHITERETLLRKRGETAGRLGVVGKAALGKIRSHHNPWLTVGLYVHHVALSMLGKGRERFHVHL